MDINREAHLRHAQYYLEVLGFANRDYLKGGDNISIALTRFDANWDQIRHGQHWAARNAETDNAAVYLSSLYSDAGRDLLDIRQSPKERLEWLENALQASRFLEQPAAESYHLGNMGIAYWRLEQIEQAISCHTPIHRFIGCIA